MPADNPQSTLLYPETYADSGYPHDTWAQLRREDPIHFVDPERGRPYWAITRHADIVQISREPQRSLSGEKQSDRQQEREVSRMNTQVRGEEPEQDEGNQ